MEQFEELAKLNQEEDDYFYHLADCKKRLGDLEAADIAITYALKITDREAKYHRLKADIVDDPNFPKDIEIKAEIISKNDIPELITIESDSSEADNTENVDNQQSEKVSHVEHRATEQNFSDKYSMMRITVVNASRNRKAANDLGFLLKRKYGLRYAVRTHKYIWNQTVVFYKDFINRNFVKEIAIQLPGVQKYESLPKNIRINKYNDLVIFIGNDCRDVARYRNKFLTLK